jgi:hypothetical protein
MYLECTFCSRPLVENRRCFRFSCMCDDEIRQLNHHELFLDEYKWRITFRQILGPDQRGIPDYHTESPE